MSHVSIHSKGYPQTPTGFQSDGARALALLVFLLVGGGLFSGCSVLSAPKVDVVVAPLSFEIQNQNDFPWQGCEITLNAEAGDEGAYRYTVPEIKAQETKSLAPLKFTRKDGRRFIPLLMKANTMDIQCQQPILPAHLNLAER